MRGKAPSLCSCVYSDERVRLYGKQVKLLVELDNFKSILNSYSKPLVEVRDSL